jgi:HEAT repeat protein
METEDLEPLLDAIRSKTTTWGSYVSEQAVEALVRIGSPAVEPLIDALHDGERLEGATMALGQIGDQRAVQPLIALIKEPPHTKAAEDAIRALGQIGDVSVIQSMFEFANNPFLAEATLEAVRALLLNKSGEMKTEDLKYIAQLVSLTGILWTGSPSSDTILPERILLDTSDIRKLACEELMRRGLKGVRTICWRTSLFATIYGFFVRFRIFSKSRG